jgi:hypothetical protein
VHLVHFLWNCCWRVPLFGVGLVVFYLPAVGRTVEVANRCESLCLCAELSTAVESMNHLGSEDGSLHSIRDLGEGSEDRGV